MQEVCFRKFFSESMYYIKKSKLKHLKIVETFILIKYNINDYANF